MRLNRPRTDAGASVGSTRKMSLRSLRAIVWAFCLANTSTALAAVLLLGAALYAVYWLSVAGTAVITAVWAYDRVVDHSTREAHPVVVGSPNELAVSGLKNVDVMAPNASNKTGGPPSGPSTESQKQCERQLGELEKAEALARRTEHTAQRVMYSPTYTRVIVQPKLPLDSATSSLNATLRSSPQDRPLLLNGVPIARIEALFSNFYVVDLVESVPRSVALMYVSLLRTSDHFSSVELGEQLRPMMDVDYGDIYRAGAQQEDLWHLAGAEFNRPPFDDSSRRKEGGANVFEAWQLLPEKAAPVNVAVIEREGVAAEYPSSIWAPPLLPGYNFVNDSEFTSVFDPKTSELMGTINNQPDEVRERLRIATEELTKWRWGQAGTSFDGTGPDGRDWDRAKVRESTEEAFYAKRWTETRGSHGASVANVISSYSTKHTPLAGVGHNTWKQTRVKIVPVRAGIRPDTIASAIRWAAGLAVPGALPNPDPAKVINVSLGSYEACPTYMQGAINDASAKGAIVVVATGNDGAREAFEVSPANCANVVAVTGHTPGPDPAFASLSNVDSNTTISAPLGSKICEDGVLSRVGLSVWTTHSGATRGELVLSRDRLGTSLSAPVVSGIVAMMLQVNPDLNVQQVKKALHETGTPFSETAAAKASRHEAASSPINTKLHAKLKMVNAYAAVLRARELARK